MKREVNNSRKCIDCGSAVPRKVKRCSACNQVFLCNRPTYTRTAAHKELMSERLKGQPHTWRSASETPEVAAKIREWWTPERRAQKVAALLKRNLSAVYHGLSSRTRKKLTVVAGKCARCGLAKPRLDTHHKDRDKHNQTPSNLEVLCHRCHMQEHHDEIGWAVYHRKNATGKM